MLAIQWIPAIHPIRWCANWTVSFCIYWLTCVWAGGCRIAFWIFSAIKYLSADWLDGSYVLWMDDLADDRSWSGVRPIELSTVGIAAWYVLALNGVGKKHLNDGVRIECGWLRLGLVVFTSALHRLNMYPVYRLGALMRIVLRDPNYLSYHCRPILVWIFPTFHSDW